MKELSRYYVARGGTIMNNAKKLYKKVYKEIIVTHTAEAHSKPSQTSIMELFAKMINFGKSFVLGAAYMEILSRR